MRVKELIAALQTLDPELHCCVMDQSETWCTVDAPAVMTGAYHGFYNLDDPLPRVEHREAFVAL